MSYKKPDNLKIVQGTFRKDRANPEAPKLEPCIPEPQKGILTRAAKKHYDRLTEILGKMRILTQSDVVSLELLATSLAEFYEAKKYLDKNGSVYRVITREGEITYRKRPEESIKNEAWQRCSILLARFGLDPVNRTRVNAMPEKKQTKWDDLGGNRNP